MAKETLFQQPVLRANHHSGFTPVTCKIAKASKARLGIAIAPNTRAARTFLGIFMLKHCALVSASTLQTIRFSQAFPDA